ncbi:MAG: DNA-directed RNA polymerase subunit omega [Bdellovibrionaceae bacterium]|nr:DNA-directed RNA polymerase subunit omega [Pseudobdellovibrionaceae bacterium]
MARITVEDCLSRVENRFALVVLAAKRTKQLLKGAQCIEQDSDNKLVVNSLREIADGYVGYDIDESKGSAAQQIEDILMK